MRGQALVRQQGQQGGVGQATLEVFMRQTLGSARAMQAVK
jgi:hypothetical protein